MSRRCTSALLTQQQQSRKPVSILLILCCLAVAFLSFSPSSFSPITFADAQLVSLNCQFVSATSSAYIGTNLTYNLYGDSGIQRRTIQCYSTIQTNIYISDVTILNQRSFVNLTVPTQGSTKPITLTLLVDVSQQLAGSYPTTFVITASPNGANPAPPETVNLDLNVVVNAALNFFTNQTDPFTGSIRSGAPANLTEGGAFSQIISLRSRPTGPVTLTITANTMSGESWGQVGPQGQQLRGGGSLIDVSTTSLLFSQASYSTIQRVVFSNVANNIMQGNRWTIVTFTFSSSDSFYQNLQIPPMNITILEKDWAQIVLTGAGVAAGKGTKLHLDVTPGTTPAQTFTIALGAAPLSNVTMNIPSGFRYTISPNTLFFTDADYSTPRTMTITILNSNVISGARVSLQNFTGAISDDTDFAGLALLPLEVAYKDPNNIMVSISPPYATWSQSATAPVQLTVSYSGKSTFLPNGIGETTLPTIACVFANTNGGTCSDPSQFFAGINAQCDYKYAQTLTTGWVISPTQITCPVPTCPSVLSTASTPGTPSAKATECTGTYKMIVLVNGEASTNAFTFIYLTPIGGAGDDQLPQVNSIEPGTIDVNSYVWITVHGANFALADKYPNPTGGDVGDSKVGLVNCKIGGIQAPAVDTTSYELDAAQKNLIPMIKCLSRPRPDLAGSTNNVPVIVEITMNGQEYTSNGKTINVFDYDKKAYNNSWTYFFVAVALVGLVFSAMLLQHFLCANFFKTHTEEAESAKIRVTRGPQMLIDLLEPQVREQTAQVKELEKQEALEAAAANTLLAENEDLVKARIAELQREAAARKEEKKRQKAEKKAQKEANKIADAARQEVLAAAGLSADISSASDSESSASGAESEREERKRKKREKKEKKEAKKAKKAAEALMSSAENPETDERKEQGIELANLSGDQLDNILGSPSEDPMTPHDGAESDAGSDKSTSRKSSKKKKKESKKKKKKNSRSDKAPLDMNEYKHQQHELGGESELSDGGASDADGASKKKKKKKDGKKSKKKKNKVGDDSDAAPSDAEFMGASSAAASEADEDVAASEASASQKKKKKKSSSKKDKKDGKSSKKKKKKAEE